MSGPPVVAFAPGRVNLIGEHTDYNDGLCLAFAVAAGVRVRARRRDAGRIRAQALDLGEQDEFDPAQPGPASGWRAIVRGICAELAGTGAVPPGAQLEIWGDVPRGVGLSSSAALEVALALALLALSGRPEPERRELARLCSRAENQWAGARTGLLDQLASLFGRAGHALLLDMRDLAIEPVPMRMQGWRLVVVDSGSRHAHGKSGYNGRRRECAVAARLLGVAALRDADPAELWRLPPPLDRRARHVIEENARVERAVAALRAGDMPALAALLDASHVSLRDLFEVSVPSVEATVSRLRENGAGGARLVGGGFGGSVLALVPPGVAPPEGALEVQGGAAAGLEHK